MPKYGAEQTNRSALAVTLDFRYHLQSMAISRPSVSSEGQRTRNWKRRGRCALPLAKGKPSELHRRAQHEATLP
jgi:hypothetical protein